MKSQPMSRVFAASILLSLLGLSQPLAAQIAPTLLLPGGTLNQTSVPGVTVTLSANYSPTNIQFLATFDAVSSGYSVANTTYTGWCADPFSDFAANPAYHLISTYDTASLLNPPGGGKAQNPNWTKVNWVLNHKPTTGAAPTWIVQQVIWKLLAGQYIAYSPDQQFYPAPAPAPFPLSAGDTTIANNLYAAANAQGSFIPGPGQVAGVLLYLDGINPDGTSTASNYVVSKNAINPSAPPLNGLNGKPNQLQEMLIEVPVTQGAIGDFVWQDTNQNGIQDAGEPGINGVTVQLCQDFACNTVLATTTTTTFQGLNGYYQFTGLPAGTFYVSVDTSQSVLSGLVPTQTGQGTPATDSNVNPSQVTLATSSSQDETIDFGFTSPGASAIGDFVWNDSNGNGLQDAGEPGIPGVKVNLCRDAACTQLVATTTTDQNGAYHFTSLLAGTYYVVVDATTLPPGFVASPSQVGFSANSAIDSNGSPAEVILAENVTDNTIDFGFVPPAQGAIGDFVWHDLNRNGIQDSDSSGNPEPGINNVTVRLYNSSNTLVGTTTTVTANGNDGYYQFTGLAAGTYTVVVDSTTLPPSYTPTTSNAAGSITANDSNGSPATVTLATNSSTDESIDFGYVSPCVGAIGDFVWNDANQNGIQDSNELGIPGVTVFLRAPDNTLIGSTTTDANGAYHFTGLCAATYTVQVVPPTGFQPSPTNAPGSTPANDSNGSPATVVLPQDATDNTIDLGFYQPLTVTGQCLSGVNSGEVGLPFNSSTPSITGGTAPYTFSIATGTLPAGLTLNPSTGQVTGTPTAAGAFTIQATDANGFVTTIPCPYTVVPPPSVTCSTVTSGEVGVSFNSPAMTVAGGVAPYTFSVGTGTLPAGLTLNASTGAITGIPTAAGTFTIQVTDSNGAVSTITCPFTIVGTPALTCAAVTSGEVGVAFNSPALTVTGGTGPYTFSIGTGPLPAGLTLNPSTGAITGTPTAAGTFTIQVTDANGVLASTTCPFTIVPPPTVTCSAVNSGEVGVAFTSPAMTVTGGTAPYTFSVATGTLPAGLTLNASTGAITGTPTAAGTFTIQVTDANGVVAAGTCPFNIVPPPTVTCSTVNSGEVSVAFNSPAMTVTGGVAPYTFSIATGTLPAGLTLNAATGAITGTPTAAGTFTIQVKDANGVVATGTCPFTIVAAPTVACSAVTSGEVSLAFNSPAMTVTGGTAPFTFSVATGTLPAGLTLNASTGAITGTPTSSGTFTIKVTDANGVVATGTCPFTIVAAPSVACSAVTSGEVGLAFSSPAMTVTGGVAPYTFSIATGTLPSGLTLNASTGAITGTPTSSGTFTVKVTDSNGVVAAGTCPFTIVAAPSVTCSVIGFGEVGVAFNSPAMTVIGGVAPYTFSIATGALPAGLTLNASTGAITGTPTAGGTFTIKLTDANGVVAPGTCPFTIVTAPSVGNARCGSVTSGEVGVPFNSPAITVTGGVAPYTFSIATGTLPAGLALNPSTGAITGTPTAAGSFTIQVTDSNGVVAASTCPFTIVAAPSVSCSAVSSGEVGVGFSSPAMTVTGGVAPYTFSIATGTLPAGLTLNASTGAITGTPTSAGTFTIKVTDANGAVAAGTCPFTIVAAPSVACSAVNSGEVGLVFTSPAMTVSGGVAPYTFSIATGSLPAGLTLSASTGAITGTPTSAGTFTIKVTDANGAVAAGTCPFTIVAAPSVTCPAVTSGEVGVAFSSPAMTVTGGVGPYTFSIGSGTLPAGLILNTATGAITGTPTSAGTFTIKVTDANGAVAAGTCPFTIVTAPSVTCPAVTSGEVGVAFNSPAMTVSGGVAPYTFSIGTGSLPNGLTLNTSTGAITGTATAGGSFTIKVTDAKGVVAAGSCPFTIAAAPSLTCPAVSSGLVGVTFNSPAMAVTGGAAPYKFSIGSGSLPAGLTLNSSTGAITGTPTAGGTFTIKVSDANGAVAITTCPFTIWTAPLVTCATGTAQVGIAYSSSVPVTGGSGSFTFSISAGSLPPGLTLNASTGAITGTPTAAGTSGFTVKVVDNVSGAVAYSACTSSCSGGGSTVNVNTYSALGNLGNSHVFSVNGTSLTAYGFNNNGTPTALYGKNESSTEQGLGIASDSDYEINTSTFIQLDVSQLVAAGFTNAQILYSSVQTGELYIVYGSNTLGSLGTKLSGPGSVAETLVAMPGYGTWKYIGIQAGNANIDIGALSRLYLARDQVQHYRRGRADFGDVRNGYGTGGHCLQFQRPGNGRKRFVHLLDFCGLPAARAYLERLDRRDHRYANRGWNLRFHR